MRYAPNREAVESGGGGKAQPGEYAFTIDEAEEVTFKTGSEGLKLTLLVGAFESKDIKVFARLSYSEKAQWRLKQMMDSIGADFYSPPEDARELEGLTGRAKFKCDEKGYLEVDEWLAGSANNGPDSKKYDKPGQKEWDDDEPPPHSDSDTPF